MRTDSIHESTCVDYELTLLGYELTASGYQITWVRIDFITKWRLLYPAFANIVALEKLASEGSDGLKLRCLSLNM